VALYLKESGTKISAGISDLKRKSYLDLDGDMSAALDILVHIPESRSRIAVLPTPGKSFRLDQQRNSAASDKIRPSHKFYT
jgi:hypothetical protein